MSLTSNQRRVLQFIMAYRVANNVVPSFEEIKVGMGFASKSNVHRIMDCLEERGYVVRLKHRARALTILRNLDGSKIEGANPPPVNLESLLTEFAEKFFPIISSNFAQFKPAERNQMMTAWARLKGQVKAIRVAA